MALDYFWVELESSLSLAIPLERTAEVVSFQWSEICPVPGIKPELLGVTNQRGQLLWVMDLNRLSGDSSSLKPSQGSRSTAIVLIKNNLRAAGVVAHLNGIIQLSLEQMTPLPLNQSCLTAQTQIDDRAVMVLDVDAVFQTLQSSNFSPLSSVQFN